MNTDIICWTESASEQLEIESLHIIRAHETKQNLLRTFYFKYGFILKLIIEAEWRIYASVNFSFLVQIMACRLVGAKPLSTPRMEYC